MTWPQYKHLADEAPMRQRFYSCAATTASRAVIEGWFATSATWTTASLSTAAASANRRWGAAGWLPLKFRAVVPITELSARADDGSLFRHALPQDH
jgi:hypothetical protein